MTGDKKEVIILRVSALEKRTLFRLAKVQGVSASEFLRASIRVSEPLVKAEKSKKSERKIELATK